MRQLLPEVVDGVDPAALYAADDRPRPAGRPWVAVNMIASADGATSVDGVSGPLGAPGDKAVFRALRAVADVVLVGAGTVRAERYGPARARIAVVTASGDLDPGLRLFAEADPARPPLVITCSSADRGRLDALRGVAEVVVAGDDRVELGSALGRLAGDGAGVVLCEGGPTLNAQLIAGGLVDEWCITFAPWLVGGEGLRSAAGTGATRPQRLRLDRLLADDEYCFARYVRA